MNGCRFVDSLFISEKQEHLNGAYKLSERELRQAEGVVGDVRIHVVQTRMVDPSDRPYAWT